MVKAVLKIGGSLAEYPEDLKRLCGELAVSSKKYSFLVVPGGGRFANSVREVDRRFHLSTETAHKMAILAMDQFGLLLSDIVPNAAVTESLEHAKKLANSDRPIVFLPSKFLFAEKALEESWAVTSDTISAFVAYRLRAGKLILVKDVDGIFTADPKSMTGAALLPQVSAHKLQVDGVETCIDTRLPSLIIESGLECYVVNGRKLGRINDLLDNKPTICSKVVA